MLNAKSPSGQILFQLVYGKPPPKEAFELIEKFEPFYIEADGHELDEITKILNYPKGTTWPRNRHVFDVLKSPEIVFNWFA